MTTSAAIRTRIAVLEKRNRRTARPAAAVLDLPPPHDAQRRIIDEAARFNVVCLGRRSGKTTLGVRLLVEKASQGVPTAWCSPTYKNLIEVWRSVRLALRGVAERVSESEHRIDLNGGGVVEMWSLEKPDALLGRHYARVVVDEAARVRNLDYAWSTVLRPTLADLIGDAFFLSTPKGRNAFWHLWHAAGGTPGWARWQMSSHCNPHLPVVELDAMQRELAEQVYAQEVLAQFIDHAGAVFQNVHGCATAVLYDHPRHNEQYAFGVDWSGGTGGDYTVIVGMEMTERRVVFMHRSNTDKPSKSLATLRALCERWSPSVIVAEQNSLGLPLVEQLQRDGLPVQPFATTNSSKAQIIDSLVLAFEQGTLAIPDDDTLIDELVAFERNETPLGSPVYRAPSGAHDDMVIALALAHSACTTNRFFVFGL